MLKNFFKTAWRNIIRYKAYSIINLVGLSCGFALALLIFTYIRHETGYDRFHEKADRLYRIAYSTPNGLKIASSPPPIAPRMKEYFPEVEDVARIYTRNVTVSLPDKGISFEETNVFFADSSLSRLFTFTPVAGTLDRMLTDPFTIVITREMARKYFADENPVGQSLLLSGKHLFKVTAVVEKFPESSHVRFNMLVPYHNMFDLESEPSATMLRNNLEVNFIISHSFTYVLLKPGATPESVDSKMEGFLKKYANPNFLVGQVFTLFPVKDIHLESTLLGEPTTVNSMSNLYLFGAAGILTLLIACINYINLSTAQSLGRLKEISIRKILGSLKFQLIAQFIAESFLFCLIALVIAMALFWSALPLLNALTDKQFVFTEVIDNTLLAASFGLLVIVTILAGAYPAYFVTRFQSVQSLKGSVGTGGNEFLRKTLIVFQLSVACVLLTGALLVFKQLRFLENMQLGFDKEMVVNVPLFSSNLNGIFRQSDSTFRSRLGVFQESVEKIPGVSKTTLSSSAPGLGSVYRGIIPDGFTREDNLFAANMVVDYNFADTYGLSVVEGRWFDRNSGTDPKEAFIVNETAIKEFNWKTPMEAIGKSINREGKVGKVVGVVKDFYFSPLTTPVSAMILELNPSQLNVLSVKLGTPRTTETISAVEKVWNGIFPEKSFEYIFLDSELRDQYAVYRNFGLVIQAFALIAILISCMGVYGLVLFVVQRKVKEIGIRKVLGAGVSTILGLIYRDFILLLLIGFVMAIPLSWYFLSSWLENFTYRTTIDPLSFVVSFLLVFFVVGLTVGLKAVRASMANPAESIRVD